MNTAFFGVFLLQGWKWKQNNWKKSCLGGSGFNLVTRQQRSQEPLPASAASPRASTTRAVAFTSTHTHLLYCSHKHLHTVLLMSIGIISCISDFHRCQQQQVLIGAVIQTFHCAPDLTQGMPMWTPLTREPTIRNILLSTTGHYTVATHNILGTASHNFSIYFLT